MLEYVLVGGNWVPSVSEFHVGLCCPDLFDPSHANSSGGVDYTCEGDVWASGDALNIDDHISSPPVYGLQWIDGSGNASTAAVC